MKRSEVELGGIYVPPRLKELWRSLTALAPCRDFCRVDLANWGLQQGILTEQEAEELVKALVIWQHEEDWR